MGGGHKGGKGKEGEGGGHKGDKGKAGGGGAQGR